jgi:hypothetical protein
MKNKTLPTFIGIDPAFRKAGFAIAIEDSSKELNFKLFKNGFEDFFFFMLHDAPPNCFIGVENSNLQNVTFNPKAGPRQHRSVGKNMAVSQMTVDFCRTLLGEDRVFEFSPKEKGAKITNLKIFSAWLHSQKYKRVDNYKGNKSEQDKRDAFQILQLTKRKCLTQYIKR